MGLLDDAIREHLDLKRRRGADPTEVERQEREVLGPVRARGEAAVDAGHERGSTLLHDDEYEPQTSLMHDDRPGHDAPSPSRDDEFEFGSPEHDDDHFVPESRGSGHAPLPPEHEPLLDAHEPPRRDPAPSHRDEPPPYGDLGAHDREPLPHRHDVPSHEHDPLDYDDEEEWEEEEPEKEPEAEPPSHSGGFGGRGGLLGRFGRGKHADPPPFEDEDDEFEDDEDDRFAPGSRAHDPEPYGRESDPFAHEADRFGHEPEPPARGHQPSHYVPAPEGFGRGSSDRPVPAEPFGAGPGAGHESDRYRADPASPPFSGSYVPEPERPGRHDTSRYDYEDARSPARGSDRAPDAQAHDPQAPDSRRPAPHVGEDEDEDVLEETPDFLQDTPDHDRLWFEQRPPRDFDFEG